MPEKNGTCPGHSTRLVRDQRSSGGDGFTVGDVRPLFAIERGGQRRVYDVSPDGQRILVNTADEHTASPFTLVVNWAARLTK
jgi:hypothetical protein